MWLRHGAAPFTDTGESTTGLSATDACRIVPGDVLPHDSKFVRRFSNDGSMKSITYRGIKST
jgi:hypothetical protein